MQVPTHSTTRVTPAFRGWGACLIADSAAPIASHCGLLHCGQRRYLHTSECRPEVLRPHCRHRSSSLQTTKVPSHSTMRTWFAVGGRYSGLIADSAPPLRIPITPHCGHCGYLHTSDCGPGAQCGKMLWPHCGSRHSGLRTSALRTAQSPHAPQCGLDVIGGAERCQCC